MRIHTLKDALKGHAVQRSSTMNLLASLPAAVLLFVCAGNVFAAPDESIQGKDQGYPTTLKRWDRPPNRVGNYSNLAAILPVNAIAASTKPRPLVEPGDVAQKDRLSPALQERLAAHLDKFQVTGMLVIQDGRILYERYQYDRKPTHLFHGWSMSKTVLGMLVGTAVQDGLIRSVDDTAATYLPSLAGTLHGNTKIKDLLQMSTGAAVVHKPTAEGGDLGRIYDNLLSSRADSFAVVKPWNERAEPAGTRFNYNELGPITLTHVLRKVTGKSLAGYAQERLWQPLGAAGAANWATDSTGVELGCIGFGATLRDWGRLGMLLADDGLYDKRQIISKDWLLKATTVAPEDKHLQVGVATSHSGYGYLTWIDAYRQRRVFSLRGYHNQFVVVAPDLKLVMVQTAVGDDWVEFPKAMYGIYSAMMAELEKR